MTHIDRRNDFQRETLLDLQQSAVTATTNLLYIVNQRNTRTDPNADTDGSFQTAYAELMKSNGRWGLLISRIRHEQLRRDATSFAAAMSAYAGAFIIPDLQSLDSLYEKLNKLNREIGERLRFLDHEQITSENAK